MGIEIVLAADHHYLAEFYERLVDGLLRADSAVLGNVSFVFGGTNVRAAWSVTVRGSLE